MKIRGRLALYGAAVMLLATIGFGVLLLLLVNQTAPEEQDRQLADLAAEVIVGLEDAPAGAFAAAEALITVDPGQTTEPFVMVLAADGTPLRATGRVDGAAVDVADSLVADARRDGSAQATVTAGDVEMRLALAAWERPDLGLSGVVVAGQSTEFVDQQVGGLFAVIVAAGVIALFVALVVGWLVSGRALRPLRDLATTTDEIGSTGDLARRLPPVKAQDEVGTLTTSFNAMLDRLAAGQAELTDALAAQRRFVADASHELRSPLTTIRNNAGFLIDRPQAAAADRAEAIRDIGAEADRMAGLVDDLLTLAQTGSRRAPAPADIDLASVLVEAAGRLGPGDEVTVRADLPLLVEGDRDALARLAWILLDNAVKHGEPPVTVTLTAAGGAARVMVSDSGPGIPAADLDLVFERFHRGDPARSPAGSGLGLAIAAEIARAHGGTIAAANSPEGGARFTVDLPLPAPPA